MSVTHSLISDFTHADSKTLPGKKGEEFIVLSETGGWSQCVNTFGKRGLIPSSYLKLLPIVDTEYVEAMFDCPPGDARVLPFKQKDVLKVLKKNQNWWTCEMVSTKKSGICPANFLKPCAAPVAAPVSSAPPTPSTTPPTPSPVSSTAPPPAPFNAPPVTSPPAPSPQAFAGNERSEDVAPGNNSRGVSANDITSAITGLRRVEPTPTPKTISSPTPLYKPPNSYSIVATSTTTSSSSSFHPSSLQSNDIATLLSTLNTLQQELNALLKQQTADLAASKVLVERILQITKNLDHKK